MFQPDYIAVYMYKDTSSPLYLLLKRSKNVYLPGIWQMVTGKIKPVEAPSFAAKREVLEETGLDTKFFYNVDVTIFFDTHAQKVAASANFACPIPDDYTVILNKKEHDECGFFSFEEALGLLAFPSQKQTLSFIHQHFVLQKPHAANVIRF